jgi:hypothetical protein
MQRPVVEEEPNDEETGEAIVHSKEPKDKPISHEDVPTLQSGAYIQEGQILSSRCEFHRAIDVLTKAMDINKESCIVLVSVRINASTERADSTVFSWSPDGWGESGIAIGAETWIESHAIIGLLCWDKWPGTNLTTFVRSWDTCHQNSRRSRVAPIGVALTD